MFALKIVTPEKIIYDGKSSYLALTTDEGEQVILDEHAPYMSAIVIGELRYTNESGTINPYAVSSGYLQIKNNSVYVLLDNAIHSQDINLDEAEEAKKRAEQLMTQIDTQKDILTLKAQIKLANLHISTAKKYKERNIPKQPSVA